ncbi:site-2 protease family protein [Thermosulfurimonas sp. F29]|uniref:site-2 protease family protein n=1 Tax=Thermosulfurimonas sp. F29 TaxID=2867247 RepID=UPI001C830E87|nr:site-2 protease family protein [Thermosulfurimonas sp. F29]MBX6423209.1 site-2 protease family protein [Thermosulfurimonas sp. F29]
MWLPDLSGLLLVAPPLLAAITFHELAHGWVAYRLGDPTAKAAGRLSLNPLRHLDPVGTLVLVLTQAIGWARPVPVNPNYFRHPRRDMMWVGLAGPGANLLLALALALIYQSLAPLLPRTGPGGYLRLMLTLGVQINVGLAVFNLLPVPPLDGSRVLAGVLPADLARSYLRYEFAGFALLVLLIFTGVVGKIIFPLIFGLSRLLLGG